MIYEVTLTSPLPQLEPAIYEAVTLSAESEQEAIGLAVDSAVQRMIKEGRTPPVLQSYVDGAASEEEAWERAAKAVMAMIAAGEATAEVVEVPRVLMTPDRLREAGTTLYGGWGWQTRLAEALNVNGSTVRRWLSGVVPIPGPAAAAIECFLERPRGIKKGSTEGGHEDIEDEVPGMNDEPTHCSECGEVHDHTLHITPFPMPPESVVRITVARLPPEGNWHLVLSLVNDQGPPEQSLGAIGINKKIIDYLRAAFEDIEGEVPE